MKTIIAKIVAGLIAAGVMSTPVSTSVSTTRTSEGHFIAPDVIETFDGNIWDVDEGGLCPQNDVVITFDTKGTADIRDDVIIVITVIDTEEVEG